MSLNIKNPEVHTLAAELAAIRKVSLTQAVLEAVRAELDREKNRSRKQGLAAELLEIGRRCRARLSIPISSADHATMLYDERGLPR